MKQRSVRGEILDHGSPSIKDQSKKAVEVLTCSDNRTDRSPDNLFSSFETLTEDAEKHTS